jgi:hypothetical protein
MVRRAARAVGLDRHGRSVLAAQAMGADLAYIGSPFIATDEANASRATRTGHRRGKAADIVYSNLFTGVHGNYLRQSIERPGMDPDNLPEGDLSTMNFGGGNGSKAKAWKDIWGSGQGIGADGVWETLTPSAGWLAWVIDEGLALIHDGQNWTPLSSTFKNLTAARSPFFAAIRFEVLEQEVTLSGASVATVAIPNRAIVLGVSTRTSVAIAGATSYSCGVAGETGKFGGSLGVAKNASNVGVIGPTAYYADTPVVITAAGGNFTGGKVRVSIQVMRFDPPAAV